MDNCELCGMGLAEGMDFVDSNGVRHTLCGRCGPSAKESPETFLMSKKGAPICDACGGRRSDNCSLIDYAGESFNICGECVPGVRENPADFLAGKRGTEPET
jgi:hypothetical protein